MGYLARIVLGAPEVDSPPTRSFDSPIVAPDVEMIDLPLLNYDGTKSGPQRNNKKSDEQGNSERRDSERKNGEQRNGDRKNLDVSGIVPAISLPEVKTLATLDPDSNTSSATYVNFVDYANDTTSHGNSAIFEPHGEQVCASGCALSRHPTGKLSSTRYLELIDAFSSGSDTQSKSALEELLFYGPQTKTMFADYGPGNLSKSKTNLLTDQLQFSHAYVSIRVVDQQGIVRTWLDPTRVPFDRRHVFEMQTKNLQPLVTSGTLKRVGLDHVWMRL